MPQASAAAKPATMLPQAQRAAQFEPSTWNADKRTVDVCFTTGAAGKRYSWSIGSYIEELEVTDKSVRLDRLNAHAAVLDTHGQYQLSDQIGVVERAWIEKGKGYATLRFSDREEIAGIVRDIENGIIRNISVGYIVHKMEDVSGPDDKIRTFRVTDWEPAEVSFVPVPFDAGAQVRSRSASPEDGSDVPTYAVEIIETARAAGSNVRDNMPPENEVPATPAANTVEHEAIAKRAADRAKADERARATGIREICRKLGLEASVGDKAIDDDTSLDAFRTLAIDAKATAEEKAPTRSLRLEVTTDEHETRAQSMATAILHRVQPSTKLDDGARRFVGRSLPELARLHLESHGVSTDGMHRAAVVARALEYRYGGMHSTSDFPYMLAAVANKSLLAGYDKIAAAQTFLPLAREATTPDFKAVSRIRRGEMPSLVKVVEGAEVTFGTIGEGRETYALSTYGRRLAITREMIINDDLSAFGSLPHDMGAAVARLESDVVWSVITSNPLMADGITLFHASHGNLAASGTVISVTSLGAARAAMRKQKGLSGKDPLNIRPKYLAVPVALETVAQQFMAQNIPDGAGNVNPFAGSFQVIAEPRLDDASPTAWYLAGDPNDGAEVVEILRLEGQQGPITETKAGWQVNGVEMKITYDFAAKAIDWRALYKNVGA